MSIKKTTIKYHINGQEMDIDFHIGNPAKGENPIGFQSSIIKKNYGGKVPKDADDLIKYVKKISDLYHIPFSEVFDYIQKESKNLLIKKKKIKQEILKIKKFIEKNDKQEG
jgi:hypothetical protein